MSTEVRAIAASGILQLDERSTYQCLALKRPMFNAKGTKDYLNSERIGLRGIARGYRCSVLPKCVGTIRMMTADQSTQLIRFITRKWPPAVGGMETYSVRLAEELSKRAQVEIIALPGHASGRSPGKVRLLSFGLRTALRLLAAREARVVHVADLASWPFAWIASIRHPRSRIVISAHGSDVSYAERSGWRGKLYRAYIRAGAARIRNARILANSNYVAGLVRRTGFEKVIVVPLATDLTSDECNERQHLLYAGRISRTKGLRFLVEQVLPLLSTEVRLGVAGPVWDESERPLLSHPQIHYLGVLSPQELAIEYSRASAVLVPTRESEGFGLVAIEGAACGAWVIGSNHSGLVDVLRDPIGVAVETNDPQAWASAISSALNRPAVSRETDARAARAEIERQYRWDRVVDATLASYDESPAP